VVIPPAALEIDDDLLIGTVLTVAVVVDTGTAASVVGFAEAVEAAAVVKVVDDIAGSSSSGASPSSPCSIVYRDQKLVPPQISSSSPAHGVLQEAAGAAGIPAGKATPHMHWLLNTCQLSTAIEVVQNHEKENQLSEEDVRLHTFRKSLHSG
jgi:hypothetical protein